MLVNKKFSKMILAGLASQLLFVTPIQASTLEQLSEKEKAKQEEILQLEATISDKLLFVNEKKSEVDELDTQISEIEAEKLLTLEDIETTKEQIAARKLQLEDRLVSLQTSSSSTNRVLMVLESESFSDFIGRFLLVGQLHAADNDRIQAAIEEETKLENLETKLEEEIQSISEKSVDMAEETAVLNYEVSALQTILSENHSALAQILSDKTTEEVRVAEEARLEKEAAEKAEAEKIAAEEAAVAAAEEAEKVAAAKKEEESLLVAEKEAIVAPVVNKPEPVIEKEPVVEQPVEPAKVETPAAPETNGRTLSVSATAYSRHESGLSNFTFTGMDLSQNPMVIAVDPSVIPLYSLVDVPGYGIAIAGDTGGAIKGNKIDLHMEDLNSAHAFGRQQLTITIIE